jgi:hypothetical protein
MGGKLPARDPGPCHRAERTTSPPADPRLRELPPRRPHSRLPGKGYAKPAASRAEARCELNRGFNATIGRPPPSLLLARGGIGPHRNQFSFGAPVAGITDRVHRAASLAPKKSTADCGADICPDHSQQVARNPLLTGSSRLPRTVAFSQVMSRRCGSGSGYPQPVKFWVNSCTQR